MVRFPPDSLPDGDILIFTLKINLFD